MAKNIKKIEQYTPLSKVLTVVFAALSIVWLFPIFEVVINSFKENSFVNLNPFALPNEESYVGFANYIKGMTFGNYPFLQSVGYSLLITVASVALILFSYYCAAFEADAGSRRMQLAAGLTAILLCGAAVPYSAFPNLYLCGLIWAATDLCCPFQPTKEVEVDCGEAA